MTKQSHTDPPKWSRTPSPCKNPDAGLKGIDHYQRRLPEWRYKLRQRLIPIVRQETPYLARMQEACRTPLLDSYFAMTANLGTHTFFMAALPICFWCGYPDLGVALVQMLALGVYWSGYVKDLLCLPRPLSPPLQRITMSGSAALEYGFPSTHTTNAVSVAVFSLYKLYEAGDDLSPWLYHSLQALCYCYAVSISFGRLYCGMHGFSDVFIGAIMGGIIAWLRIAYGATFDLWILTGGWLNMTIAVVGLILAVRLHPEPADNCPCFDDSVAFSGVVMGVVIGTWDYAFRQGSVNATDRGLERLYPFSNDDPLKALARVLGGVVIVFLWRAAMKPALLWVLPPVFRFVDHWGLRLPRRYFLQARYYNRVPPLRKDDNVLPPALAIPAMLSNIPNPRRRTVSVGPQSEADVREHIAYREERRRNSRSSSRSSVTSFGRQSRQALLSETPITSPAATESALLTPADEGTEVSPRSTVQESQDYISKPSLQLNNSRELLTPPPSDNGISSDNEKQDEQQDQRMFMSLEKPRIRYDVEVVTKLVVYAGIAWLAVEGNPLLFERIGLV